MVEFMCVVGVNFLPLFRVIESIGCGNHQKSVLLQNSGDFIEQHVLAQRDVPRPRNKPPDLELSDLTGSWVQLATRKFIPGCV